MTFTVTVARELLLVKLTGADGPWFTLMFTWQLSNFIFGTIPDMLDVELGAAFCG